MALTKKIIEEAYLEACIYETNDATRTVVGKSCPRANCMVMMRFSNKISTMFIDITVKYFLFSRLQSNIIISY
jgi:hypothetical protein